MSNKYDIIQYSRGDARLCEWSWSRYTGKLLSAWENIIYQCLGDARSCEWSWSRYIYIYPCTGGNYYLHGKLSFTIVLVSIHIHIQVQEEMITYMENDHLPCLGLGIYTHISMYKRKLLSSWEMIIFHLNGLGLDEYVSPCKGENYYLHEKLSLTILGK